MNIDAIFTGLYASIMVRDGNVTHVVQYTKEEVREL